MMRGRHHGSTETTQKEETMPSRGATEAWIVGAIRTPVSKQGGSDS